MNSKNLHMQQALFLKYVGSLPFYSKADKVIFFDSKVVPFCLRFITRVHIYIGATYKCFHKYSN